jgi:hypothetical protein
VGLVNLAHVTPFPPTVSPLVPVEKNPTKKAMIMCMPINLMLDELSQIEMNLGQNPVCDIHV